MNGLTVLAALSLADLNTVDTLAVTGLAGTLGGYVVQLADHRGLRVIADASAADNELVRGFGATEVVPRGEDVAERIRELAPHGVNALIDAAVQGDAVIPALADSGRYLAVRWAGIGGDTTDSERIVRHDIRVADHVRDSGGLEELVSLVEAGVLTPRVADVLPATEAADASRQAGSGAASYSTSADSSDAGYRRAMPMPKRESVDDFFAQVTDVQRPHLEALRELSKGELSKAADPQAREELKYNVPVYVRGRNASLWMLQNFTNHCSLRFTTEFFATQKSAVTEAGFEAGEGFIKLPYNRELPIDLIKKLMRARIADFDATGR